MLKVYATLAAIALAAIGFLHWQNSALNEKLTTAKIRADNAIADTALIGAAIKAQSEHTARVEAAMQELLQTEDAINRMEGANAPLDPDTISFLRSIGLLNN